MTDQNIAGAASLGADINKVKSDISQETKVGVASDKLPELTLEMDDKELITLTSNWKGAWDKSPKKSEWLRKCEENEKYWEGKQADMPKNAGERPLVDNLIFESLETYLPQMTRRNPEPLVTLDAREPDEPVNVRYVDKVKKRLADLADKTRIRLKLKKAGRHWAIYLLGVAKYGYDLDNQIPSVRIVRGKRLILDPDAVVDEDGYTGERIGEFRKLTAGKIKAIIGDDITDEITKQIDELTQADNDKPQDATEIRFIEWWTPKYFCWRLGDKIILKKQNPHWNYDTDATEAKVDDYGNENPGIEERKGINHFMVPKMPYSFLTVFNLGDQPMDNTSLIGQNLAIQDSINKRNKQIDDNVDDMNGGIVISLGRAGLSAPQAKNVAMTLRKKGSVAIPDGLPREAIDRYPAPALPADVFTNLYDMRDRLRDLFGVKGSSQAGLEGEKTVRGKLVSRMLDTDRVGGGVSEYLEQFADEIYNWFVQLLYVYDDDFQFVAGAEPPRLVISVKEGSLLPKDSMTLANQAIDLAIAGKMSLLDLFKKLEYPNPEELAANVWLEQNAPQLLYPDNPLVQQAMGMQQEAAAAEAEAQATEGQKKHERSLETEAMKGVARSMPPVEKIAPQSEPATEELIAKGL